MPGAGSVGLARAARACGSEQWGRPRRLPAAPPRRTPATPPRIVVTPRRRSRRATRVSQETAPRATRFGASPSPGSEIPPSRPHADRTVTVRRRSPETIRQSRRAAPRWVAAAGPIGSLPGAGRRAAAPRIAWRRLSLGLVTTGAFVLAVRATGVIPASGEAAVHAVRVPAA